MKFDKNKEPITKLYSGVRFRFEYMYFQWLEKVPDILQFNNLTFHGQLHVVFYDSTSKNIEECIKLEKIIFIMAIGIKVNPMASNNYEELEENLKIVRQPVSQTVIKSMPLAHWLKVSMKHYCIYLAPITFFNTKVKGLWQDILEPIEITPDLVR